MYYVAKVATDKRTVIGQGLTLEEAVKLRDSMNNYNIYEDGGKPVSPTIKLVKEETENVEKEAV